VSTGELAFHAQKGSSIEFEGATLTPGSPLRLSGSGAFLFDGANALPTGAVIEHDGDHVITIDDTGGLPATTTLNLNAGRLNLNAADAVATGADVNIKTDGLFTVDVANPTGSFHVQGGAVRVSSLTHLGGADTFDWSGGGMLATTVILDSPLVPTNGKVDVVLSHHNADSFPQDLVLGQGRRLTMGHGCGWADGGGVYFNFSSDTDVTLAATATAARIATYYSYSGGAGTAKWFEIDGVVTFDNAADDATLIIGDSQPLRCPDSSGGAWTEIPQDGAVRLTNAANSIDNILIEGRLYVRNPYYLDTLGNPIEIRLADTGIYEYYDSHTLTTTLSGTGTAIGRDNSYTRTLRIKGMREGDAPAGAHLGTLSPGHSVGRIDFKGHMGFYSSDYGADGMEYAHLDVEVAGSGGAPGEDHDYVYVTGNVYDLNNARLNVYLPAPSNGLALAVGSPTPYVDGDMTIMHADGSISGGGFSDVVLDSSLPGLEGDAVADHWAVTSGTAVSVAGGDVVLHGSALYWTGRRGNANLDEIVDVLDLARLANNFGKDVANGDEVTWLTADFNLDGKVDVLDLAAIANNFGKTGSIAASGPGGPGGGAPVPEPGSAALLVLGLGAIVVRRRRAA